MSPGVTKAIALGPDHLDLAFLVEAIERGGGTVTAAADAEALIWASPRRPTKLVDTLHDGCRSPGSRTTPPSWTIAVSGPAARAYTPDR